MSKNLTKAEWLKAIKTYRKNESWETEREYRKITIISK